MKPLVLVALSLSLVAPPALAASHSQIVPKGSLYYEAADTPPDEIPTLCDRIVAGQNSSKIGMRDAAQLYFHGKLMGVHCVKVDYVKSLELSRAAGDAFSFNTFLRLIREKADAGNAVAAKVLTKTDISPM